jgi:integrase
MAGNVARRPDGAWRARYRDPSGREHSQHFDRKLDAQRWLASVEIAQARGEWLDPNRARMRVGEWARSWLAGQVQLKPSTRARYELAVRRQILPTWRNVPLAEVTYADVATWVQRLAASHLAPASVRYAHRVLSLILDDAVRDGRLARNPATGVRLPRVIERQKLFLSHEQVADLAATARPYGTLINVLAYTGLRWGEAAALRVGRVDLTRRRLEIVEATSEVRGEIIFGTPKTHQRRSVPFPRFLTEPLARLVDGRAPADVVFTSPDGHVLRNTNFRRRVFDPAARAAGLEGLTPHELRHTAASLAVAAGANIKAVQQMLGHASAAMTLDVYAGLFADDLDAVAERLDAAVTQRRADSIADFLRTNGLQRSTRPLPRNRERGR